MFCPKHSHELALKRIGRYLKQTPDRGMVMNPSSDVCKTDAYPDADLLVCMVMRNIQNLPAPRVGLDLSKTKPSMTSWRMQKRGETEAQTGEALGLNVM